MARGNLIFYYGHHEMKIVGMRRFYHKWIDTTHTATYIMKLSKGGISEPIKDFNLKLKLYSVYYNPMRAVSYTSETDEGDLGRLW